MHTREEAEGAFAGFADAPELAGTLSGERSNVFKPLTVQRGEFKPRRRNGLGAGSKLAERAVRDRRHVVAGRDPRCDGAA
jgi:hypothetical protein